jgi:two-component system sensor kinase FixL
MAGPASEPLSLESAAERATELNSSPGTDEMAQVQGTVEHRQPRGSLRERLRIEEMIADVSTLLAGLPAAEIDEAIEQALRRLVEFVGAGRCTLGEFLGAEGRLVAVHSHARPGMPVMTGVDLTERLPWLASRLRAGEEVFFVSPGEFPPEAVAERREALQSGIQSHISLPLRVGGTIRFAIGISSSRHESIWPLNLLPRLRTLGEILANTLSLKRAEESLIQSEAQFRTALDSSPDAMLLIDQRGAICYANESSSRMFGHPVEELLGASFEILIPERLRQAHQAQRESHIADPRTRPMAGQTDLTAWHRDGHEFPVEISLSSVRGETGPQVFCHIRDLTESRRREAEFARLRQELTHVSRVTTMGELSASFAHEINQPLAGILSNAQAAQRFLNRPEPDLAEIGSALADIVEDGQRASGVIRHMKELMQRGITERVSFDLAVAIREILGLLRIETLRKGVVVRSELPSDLPPVLGDRVQIQQVVMNLILNAIEAMKGNRPGDREVVVRAMLPGDGTAVVSIEDRGEGLDEQTLERVFEPFFTTKSGGMGMGLYICRSILQAHHDRLWATANPERGVTFHFNLPVWVEEVG